MTQSTRPLKADPGFIFESGKTYPHSIGLSCCFRQWKADSHCRLFHGYSIQISAVFRAEELDERNWVVDFGSLKAFKGFLEDRFDHKMLVAEDDPELDFIRTLEARGLAQIRVMPQVGMEACSYWIYQVADGWLYNNGYAPRVTLQEVEVREHEANFARYRRNS